MQPVLLREKYKRFKHWYKNHQGYNNSLFQICRSNLQSVPWKYTKAQALLFDVKLFLPWDG